MPIDQRTRSKLPSPGPYLARITNIRDPMRMGSLEVVLEKGFVGDSKIQSQTYPVQYLSPFYGVTGIQFEGTDPRKFDDVQKSYGFWMVPPDIGTRVLVLFIDGDPNQGYWFGCVPDTFQNWMVPGLAASQNVYMTPEDELRYGTKLLPVAEFHKKSKKDLISPDSQKKPIHPFADRLLAQGLLLDTVRGVTSSSARREAPSSVFGISTPGPIDPNGKTGLVGYQTKTTRPVSRLGGTQFVMDDGDDDGRNELVRIRTRTGHQILMHNSSDLIYIGNSKGTAWIELTSNGKIDIYAQDSVSIHTEVDFNFRADRDINIEAGRNLNIKTQNSTNINVNENYNLIVSQDSKILIQGSQDKTVVDVAKFTANSDFHLKVGQTVYQSSGSAFNIKSGADSKFTAAGNTNIKSGGNHLETAAQIHMNGPAATAADAALQSAQPVPLQLFSLPNRNTKEGWANANFYKTDPINSIMLRVPTHEPWDQHENIDPVRFNTSNTDVSVGSTLSAQDGTISLSNNPVPQPNSNQPSDWSSDADFIQKVKSVSASLGCNYIDMLCCIAFETGRKFDPSLRNFIGATGLIQFIPSAAKSLGTTTDYLASLTRTQQMDWVQKYFKAGPVAKVLSPSLEDLYMAILWPVAVGKPNSYVLFTAGSTSTGKAYSQNSGLDINKDGNITKEEAAAKVKAQENYVKQQLVNAGYSL